MLLCTSWRYYYVSSLARSKNYDITLYIISLPVKNIFFISNNSSQCGRPGFSVKSTFHGRFLANSFIFRHSSFAQILSTDPSREDWRIWRKRKINCKQRQMAFHPTILATREMGLGVRLFQTLNTTMNFIFFLGLFLSFFWILILFLNINDTSS